MGEARKRALFEAVLNLTRDLVDRGMLVEAGFAAFIKVCYPHDLPTEQLRELRIAYMAGAEHLWFSVMNVMDDHQEVTDRDMLRAQHIDDELTAFRAELEQRARLATGRAKGKA